MLFDKRRRVVVDIASAEELAEKLKVMTWCCCQGFRLGDYLFLNDSTSEDEAQEYAVIHEPSERQCESITFGWCSHDEALEYIQQTLRGEFKAWNSPTLPAFNPGVVQTPEEHGVCQLCA